MEITEEIELAAILHDVADWKYSGSETAGKQIAVDLLKKLSYEEDKIKTVQYILENVSFHSELGMRI